MTHLDSMDGIAADSGVPMEQKLVTSYDGTSIVYRIRRAGPRWLLIANGYAGTFVTWRTVIPRLDPRLSILMWDYRGMYRSGLPANRANLTIQDDSRDLECILETEGIDRGILLGWSVGVQVALEHWRRRPDQVTALILHNGLAERVLSEAADGRYARYVLQPAAHLLANIGGLIHPAKPLLKKKTTAQILAKAGVVIRNIEQFRPAMEAVVDLDLPVYFQMVLEANRHRTEPVWKHVSVPTLVTYGKRDFFSPRRAAKRVADAIPDARLAELPGGHYSLIEFPERTARVFQSFIDEIGDTQTGDKPGVSSEKTPVPRSHPGPIA